MEMGGVSGSSVSGPSPVQGGQRGQRGVAWKGGRCEAVDSDAIADGACFG